ncbi:MAG: ammonium transporter, partial [Firmicutes bacterium]|nr:ammonium transporter [Bacillota bacterium]
ISLGLVGWVMWIRDRFYGGLVRSKNMLSVMMQVSTVAIIGFIAWVFWGYSFAFTDGGSWDSFVGGLGRLFLKDVTPASNVATFSTGVVIPELSFISFQATFAAITAALVVGSLVERMKFAAIVAFAVLWPLLSYYPMAHMVWWWPGPDAIAGDPTAPVKAGLIWSFGALDFAGGTVVHILSGVSGLVACLVIGRRKGYGSEPMIPHNLPMTVTGTALLWFGWFGFNAGSALAAGSLAGSAFVVTHLATAAAALSWVTAEWLRHGKPTVLGAASGAVAGLVAITPASGFVDPMASIIIGLVAGVVCYLAVSVVKAKLRYDDSLDAFGVHGIGGTWGALATGIFANPAVNPAGAGLLYGNPGQVITQIISIAASWAVAAAGTFIILKAVGAVIKLRATDEEQEAGLDITQHGEDAYTDFVSGSPFGDLRLSGASHQATMKPAKV